MIEASTNMMDLGYHLHPTISGFSAFFLVSQHFYVRIYNIFINQQIYIKV